MNDGKFTVFMLLIVFVAFVIGILIPAAKDFVMFYFAYVAVLMLIGIYYEVSEHGMVHQRKRR
jgi:hypothetical protein